MKPGADSVTRITIMGSAVIRKLDGTVLRIPEDLPGYQCRPRQSALLESFFAKSWSTRPRPICASLKPASGRREN
jgi:hypothetical protein